MEFRRVLFRTKNKECQICHHVAEDHTSLEEEEGELVQIDGKKLEVTKDEKQRWLSGLYWIAAQRGYKQGWAANQYRERFGVWPKGLSQITTKPDIDVEAFVHDRKSTPSELQSLMRISYAVLCLKKQKTHT